MDCDASLSPVKGERGGRKSLRPQCSSENVTAGLMEQCHRGRKGLALVRCHAQPLTGAAHRNAALAEACSGSKMAAPRGCSSSVLLQQVLSKGKPSSATLCWHDMHCLPPPPWRGSYRGPEEYCSHHQGAHGLARKTSLCTWTRDCALNHGKDNNEGE